MYIKRIKVGATYVFYDFQTYIFFLRIKLRIMSHLVNTISKEFKYYVKLESLTSIVGLRAGFDTWNLDHVYESKHLVALVITIS